MYTTRNREKESHTADAMLCPFRCGSLLLSFSLFLGSITHGMGLGQGNPLVF